MKSWEIIVFWDARQRRRHFLLHYPFLYSLLTTPSPEHTQLSSPVRRRKARKIQLNEEQKKRPEFIYDFNYHGDYGNIPFFKIHISFGNLFISHTLTHLVTFIWLQIVLQTPHRKQWIVFSLWRGREKREGVEKLVHPAGFSGPAQSGAEKRK